MRLAEEYLRTGREIHRQAFERYVPGMVNRAGWRALAFVLTLLLHSKRDSAEAVAETETVHLNLNSIYDNDK